MPITSPGNDDDTGENHQPTLRKNTAEPVEQTLKQNNPDLPMDSSNSAEDTLAFAACGATLGKLPQKPAAAVSTLSPKLSRPKHHGLEVMALHMPTGIYLPTLLTA